MLNKTCLICFVLFIVLNNAESGPKSTHRRYIQKSSSRNVKLGFRRLGNSTNWRISELACLNYIVQLKNRQKQLNNETQYDIINGKKTKPAEFPHMGALGWLTIMNRWVFQCGGSLISSNYVLTAAHCSKIPKKKKFKSKYPKIVRFGARNIELYNYMEPPVDIRILHFIVHPYYNSPYHYYDIALIQLKEEITFNKFIQPACLQTNWKLFNNDQKFTVTGWGFYKTEPGTMTSSELLSAEVDVIDTNYCRACWQKHFNRNFWCIRDHQLCAGKLDGSVDTCNGDSGGPLQYKLFDGENEGSIHKVIGITSFGGSKNCAKPKLPGVYTRVSSFINWIEWHVWLKSLKRRKAYFIRRRPLLNIYYY